MTCLNMGSMKFTNEEQGSEKISFDSILNELTESTATNVVGSYEFKELTMKQQRKILNGGYDGVEISAKFANVYNEFICENVTLTDSPMSVAKAITLDVKPYVLNKLRTISLGNVYYDDETDKEYVMREVSAEDLVSKVKDEVIEFGNIKITLSVPNLEKDSKYNQLLCIALKPYKGKKNLSEADTFPVMDMYQLYEIYKYISVVSFKGKDYNFDEVAMPDKQKMVNALHAKIVNQITEYIRKVEDIKDVALTATCADSGETVVPNMYTMFFAKTSR